MNQNTVELTILDNFQLDSDEVIKETIATESGLRQYLHDIAKYDVLSREEELKLIMACKAGDSLAFDEFIKHNLKLVVSIVRRYKNFGVEFLDLIQEGNLGLMHAVENFNPSLGFKFSTYATFYIKRAALDAINAQGKMIRLPKHLVCAQQAIKKVTEKLKSELNRMPTIEEISKAASIPMNKIVDLQLLSQDIISMDAPAYQDNEVTTVGDTVATEESIENIVNTRLLAETLNNKCEQLDDQAKFVVTLRYGFHGCNVNSYEAIGKLLKLSKERVRQIEVKALRKLRHI